MTELSTESPQTASEPQVFNGRVTGKTIEQLFNDSQTAVTSSDEAATQNESDDTAVPATEVQETEVSNLDQVEDVQADEPQVKLEMHWPDAIKEAFSSLQNHPDAQRALMEVHKGFERRHQEKSDVAAKKLRSAQEAQKVLDRNQDLFDAFKTQSGLYPSQIMNNLLQTARSLQNNPGETIKALARQYNVPLDGNNLEGQASDEGGDDYADPTLKRLEAVERQLQSYQRQSIQEPVNRFMAEANEGKWPYFERVKPQMASLLNSGAVSGSNEYEMITKAYSMAVSTNGEFMEEEIQRRVKDAMSSKEKAFHEKKVTASPTKKVAPTGVPSVVLDGSNASTIAKSLRQLTEAKFA